VFTNQSSPDEIIDSVAFLRKGKTGKDEKIELINRKEEIAVFIDLSASVEMTLKKGSVIGRPSVVMM
jgi:hypothetical protein